jgi:hypothetical protein
LKQTLAVIHTFYQLHTLKVQQQASDGIIGDSLAIIVFKFEAEAFGQ